jgi:hypothetical protein
MMDSRLRACLAAALILVSQIAIAEQTSAERERAAADDVARIVQQVRRQNGLSKLRRIRDQQLRTETCERGKHDDESASIAGGSSWNKAGTISYVRYSTSNPQEPSPKLLEWAARKDSEEQAGWRAHRFAVGICFIQDARHPEGRYWICVSKYLGAIKSFFYMFVWE